MFEPEEQENYTRLVETLEAGDMVAYVGAGLSAADQPSWCGLHESLQQAAGIRPERPFTSEDAPIDFKAFRDALNAKFVLEVQSAFSQPTAPSLDLYRLIDENQGIGRIVTTNVDEYLGRVAETAVPLPEINRRVIEYSRLHPSDARYVYLHGRARNAQSYQDLVLDQDVYDEAYLIPGVARDLLRLLAHGPILFVGCSMRDPDLTVILREINSLYKKREKHRPDLFVLLAANPRDDVLRQMVADMTDDEELRCGDTLLEVLEGQADADRQIRTRQAFEEAIVIQTQRFREKWQVRAVWYEWDPEHSRLRRLLSQLQDEVGSVRPVPLFTEQATNLARIGGLTEPSNQDVDHVIALLSADPRLGTYFFSNATSSAWFDALRDTGLLTRTEAGRQYPDGTMTIGNWPAAPYIERISVARPDAVVWLIHKMEATDNLRVQEVLSRVTQYLAGEDLMSILPVIFRWNGGDE